MMGCAFHGLMWAVSALLLGKLLFRGFRHHHHRRFGGGCGPRGFSGGSCGHRAQGWDHGDDRDFWHDESSWEHGHDRHRHRRGRFFGNKLAWLFRGLDTTPEQERVLHETFGDLKSAGGKIAGKVAASKNQWADALEAEAFDETMVGSAVADLEHAVDEARKTAIDAFAKVHATLDAEQRKRLAGFLRRRGNRFGGPYRSVL